MNKNVGSADKIIRLALGAIAVALAIFAGLGATLTSISLVVAVVLIGTAVFNFCPAYRLLGLRTCKVESAKVTN